MNKDYRPDIDGLRTLAVFSVVVYHMKSAWLPGGFLGVDIFFVISGYVVTGSLLASQKTTVLSFTADFYAKRLARILPALVLMLLVSAYVATCFIPFAWLSGFSETTALAAFWGLSNWVMQQNADTYFAPRAEFNPYTHTWSLGVEEQFYLAAPLLIYMWIYCNRKQWHQWRWVSSLSIGSLAAVSLVGAFWEASHNPEVGFYFVGCRFWELAVGVMLQLWSQSMGTGVAKLRTRSLGRHVSVVASAAGLTAIGLALIKASPAQALWPWTVMAITGTAILLTRGLTGAQQGDVVHGFFSSPPMVWWGKRSYSIYLWHWPVLVVMRWTTGIDTATWLAAALGTTLLLACVSYVAVETPLRHNARIEKWPVGAQIVFFLLLPAIGFWTAGKMFENRNRISLSTVSRQAADWYAGDRMPFVDLSARVCAVDIKTEGFNGGTRYTYSTPGCAQTAPEKTLYVLGDSHARAYHPMFDQLSADTRLKVVIFEYPGCPFIDFLTPIDNRRPAGCLEFTQSIQRFILEQAKASDMLFLPSLRIYRYGDQWASFNIPNMYERMYNEHAKKERDAALQDAVRWLVPIAEKKLDIIFEAPKPIFKAPAFRCSDWFNAHNPICVGNNRQSRQELQTLREPILDEMRQFGGYFNNISIWDPFPVLCPDEVCTTSLGGRSLYFDGDHPSGFGNAVLYPSFKSNIETHLR